ncbi:MAG: metallophosphoesterase [Deltaproteobacteria bacterium]|nr:metallophosphoesterase [Deltaproteobacteria bacterium]
MRIAVISDIHGNMEALNEVFDDIEKYGVDTVICLGDMVGYGPEPEVVVQQIISRDIPTIMGNHELAMIDPSYLKWFNPAARQSILTIMPWMSEESMTFISNLETSISMCSGRFVHGFPPDSIITYLFQIDNKGLMDAFGELEEKICFIGHTHKMAIVSYDGKTVIKSPLKEGLVKLYEDKKYIINNGSVGQPRDGNNTAKYLIWDVAEHSVDIRFVPYHIARVTNKIVEAGLPEAHADRLW